MNLEYKNKYLKYKKKYLILKQMEGGVKLIDEQEGKLAELKEMLDNYSYKKYKSKDIKYKYENKNDLFAALFNFLTKDGLEFINNQLEKSEIEVLKSIYNEQKTHELIKERDELVADINLKNEVEKESTILVTINKITNLKNKKKELDNRTDELLTKQNEEIRLLEEKMKEQINKNYELENINIEKEMEKLTVELQEEIKNHTKKFKKIYKTDSMSNIIKRMMNINNTKLLEEYNKEIKEKGENFSNLEKFLSQPLLKKFNLENFFSSIFSKS
jgi:hypothetical protein